MKEKVTKPANVEEVKAEVVEEVPAMPEAAEMEKGAQAQPTMLDLPTAINTVIARTEATAIVVSVVNAFLDIIQQRESALSPEELGKIQAAIDMETGKTDALYREIEKVLASQVTPAAPEVEESSETESAE